MVVGSGDGVGVVEGDGEGVGDGDVEGVGLCDTKEAGACVVRTVKDTPFDTFALTPAPGACAVT